MGISCLLAIRTFGLIHCCFVWLRFTLFDEAICVRPACSLYKQITASNLDLFDCGDINTAKQQVLIEAFCVSASEMSYLGPLNGATFRAEPEQSQMGINDWALTGWLRCLPVTYGMTSSSTYYYTKAMTDLFVNTAGESGVKFQSISAMTDFWTVSFPLYSFFPPMFTTVRNHWQLRVWHFFRMNANSMPRVHYWMASTGLNGTITSPWTAETSPSSTMRTCCWGSPEWGRSR